MFSEGKFSIIFNFILLTSSLFLMFYIVLFWHIWEYTVILSFIMSTIISFFVFHFLKLILLKDTLNSEYGIHHEDSEVSGKKVLLLFIFILLILVFPIVILFVIPRLFLVIALGIVCGASISNLLTLQSEKSR